MPIKRRGRPRKNPLAKPKPIPKIAFPKKVEILPPDSTENQGPPVVEIKHKTEWSELRPIESVEDDKPDFEELDDLNLYDEGEGEGDSETTPTKKPLNDRQELKKKLQKANITPNSQLKLSVSRYVHSDAFDGAGGHFAETEHCTKYVCTEEHITSEDYLDTARKFGPGLYRFTLRLRNTVAAAWDKRISAAAAAGGPASSTSEQAPTSTPASNGAEPAGQMPSLKDYMRGQREALREQLEMAKLLRETFGQTPAPPTDPKVAYLQLIAENPDVMSQIGAGLAKSALGVRGDEDPWASVALELIKSGQAAQILRAGIDGLFSGIGGLFPRPASNGPAPVAPEAPWPAGAPGAPGATVSTGGPSQPPPPGPPVMVTPADALMLALIGALERNAPLREAQTIINLAIVRSPELGESIDEILNLSTDEILSLLAAYQPQVTAIPHAAEWITTLVNSLAANQEHERVEK